MLCPVASVALSLVVVGFLVVSCTFPVVLVAVCPGDVFWCFNCCLCCVSCAAWSVGLVALLFLLFYLLCCSVVLPVGLDVVFCDVSAARWPLLF